MRACLAWVIAATACGRIGFDATGDSFFGASRCPSDVVFCEDFEAPHLDPALWTLSSGPGTLALDSSRAARGMQSLHARGPSSQSVSLQAEHVQQNALPDPLYARVFLYAGELLPQDTEVMLWLVPSTNATGVQLETDFENQLTYDSWGLGQANSFSSTVTFDANRWVCIEWEVHVGSPGAMSLSIDDSPATGMQDVARKTPPELFGVILGAEFGNVSGGPTIDLWADELILDSAPIGCTK